MRIPLLGTWGRASFRARLVGVAAGAFVVDALSKLVGVELLEHRSVGLGWVSLRVIRNSGFAFGVGASMSSGVVLTVTASVVTIVVVSAWRGWLTEPGAGGLILGGALANVLDRAVDGKVVDLIDVGPWPTFNLADGFIVIGVVLLALRSGSKAGNPPRRAETGSSGSSKEG